MYSKIKGIRVGCESSYIGGITAPTQDIILLVGTSVTYQKLNTCSRGLLVKSYIDVDLCQAEKRQG